MTRKKLCVMAGICAVFAAGYVLGRGAAATRVEASPRAAERVFEMRTYTTHEGKLEALNARFRNHTTRLFERHGMTNVGYWVPEEAPLRENTLIYIIAHASREAAQKSWQAFSNDAEWQKAKAESEAGGKIVSKVESVFMRATDYSLIK
ncbi:MAG: NIPSNAP family protein [Pyrinomonadaceae bacterium]